MMEDSSASGKPFELLHQRLLKAAEMSKAEKNIVATTRSFFPREEDRSFRYASLASGLDIVREALTNRDCYYPNHHGRAKFRAPASAAWPVCAAIDTYAPHRMGAGLTYANRCYALIAFDDDLDAPNTQPVCNRPAECDARSGRQRRPVLHRPPLV